MRTERDRCLEALTYTWVCPRCKTAQADSERRQSGVCRTCVSGWQDAWMRSLELQGRSWVHDHDVCVSETAVAQKTAEHPSRVRTLRSTPAAQTAAETGPAVIAVCSDHLRVPPPLRSPGSTRDKSYRTQVVETVWMSALFGAGMFATWLWYATSGPR